MEIHRCKKGDYFGGKNYWRYTDVSRETTLEVRISGDTQM